MAYTKSLSSGETGKGRTSNNKGIYLTPFIFIQLVDKIASCRNTER